MDYRVTLERVRTRLAEAARKQELVSYEDILAAPEFGVSDDENKKNYLGAVLGEISQNEVLMGRPPLSAICVRKNEGTAGPEFRRFIDPAKQLSEKQLKAMWQFMRDEVFKSWKKRKESAQPFDGGEEE